MKIKTTRKTNAVFFALAITAGSAQMASAATAIPLTNAGFESDSVGSGSGGILTPAGWALHDSESWTSYVGDGSWLSPSGIAGAHSGDQYSLVFTFPGQYSNIRQDTGLLWSSLSAGDTLTVGAWTTYRSDLAGTATIRFSLNDSDGSNLFSPATNATVGAAAGVWTQRSWTYTVTQEKIDQANSELWGAVDVQVGILNSGGGLEQTLFDDVSLVHSAIPEPSGIALGGLGLGLLVLRRKRCL
jgi:hypothetical protein